MCPFCGYEADRVSAIGGEGWRLPKVGDVSLCVSCGGLGIWTAFGLRVPNPLEAGELTMDRNIQTALAAWREVKGRTQ